MEAIVVPNCGTVCLREDGSVLIVDRSRARYYLDAALVQAIVDLANNKAMTD